MASTACFLHHHAPTTTSKAASHRLAVIAKPTQLVCRAQKQSGDDESSAAVSRRLALTILIGGAAIGTKASPADAAYGEAANVFGKPKENTDYLPINRDGFKVMVPSKWNPSKEVEFPGTVLRYEDNFDANSNVTVIVTPTAKKSIGEYGSPEEFLSQVDYLLGKQTYAGKTQLQSQ